MSYRAQRASSRDPSIRLDPAASIHRAPSTRSIPGAQDYSNLSTNPIATSPIAASFEMARSPSAGPVQDELDVIDGRMSGLSQSGSTRLRSASSASVAASAASGISRSNTLRKQKSLSKKGSLSRKSSRRSMTAGSIGGVVYDDTSGVDTKSVFYTPVPTSGSPTDILANRFQAWRKVLKDIITYFREVQTSYESRAKATNKVASAINNITFPVGFMGEGGISEATKILQQHHKQAIAETAKAKEIERDVISQLAGLRSDLGQKIKEIKSLSGDFKNSVDKEKINTKKTVTALQESLSAVDSDAKAMVGKDDPYIVRLAVERQIDRQIDEENYLHRAYLNIEGSGRELESIVVGEIQKAYNAFATILKKEADEGYDTVEKLREGPISIPQDLEWSDFIEKDPHFITPDTPVRNAQDLEYPGKNHPAAAEVRAGMLERKSKYLKSYTAGWFVLSPTHLHEFKSPESVNMQAPVISLYLQDQKLGSHSQPDGKSHKFILKGRQTGTMHRGHSWVFRAETYDTMLAWYDDIQSLITKTGEDRNEFVRRHARSVSGNSVRSGASSLDIEEDEADRIPYSAHNLLATNGVAGVDAADYQEKPLENQRPQPGGRFPSDLQLRSDLPARSSQSSHDSDTAGQHDLSTVAGEFQQTEAKPEEYAVREPEEAAPVPAVAKPSSPAEHALVRSNFSPAPNEYASRSGPGGKPKPVPQQFSLPEPQAAELCVTTPNPIIGNHGNQPNGAFGAAELPDPFETSGFEVPKNGAVKSHVTGEKLVSPALNRKSTDVSLSHFHVPGEYPKAGVVG